MKHAHILLICCFGLLHACSFPKVASKNAVITTGSVRGSQEPPIVAPRLLSTPVPVRTFSVQTAGSASSLSTLNSTSLSETILFPTNQYHLSPLAISLIADFAQRVRQGTEQILINGYTDSRDTVTYNRRLSENRAVAVRDALIAQGISPQRLVIKAFGETHPTAPNNTAIGRQQNRRVEISVMSSAAMPSSVINSQFTAPRFK